MSKKDYAKKIGVSERTLRSWLNGGFYSDLMELGYCKLQKKLTAKQVFWLDLKLVHVDGE